jgi:hypothetical protein
MTDRLDGSQSSRKPPRILLRPRPNGDEQKRAFDRTSTHREVPLHAASTDDWTDARLVNISPAGLQLAAPQSVEIDALVDVEVEVFPGRVLTAVVRWVKTDPDGGYLLGAEWREPLPVDDVWKIRTYESAD